MCGSALGISGYTLIYFQQLLYELYYPLFLLLQILFIYFNLPVLTSFKINFLQLHHQYFPQIILSYWDADRWGTNSQTLEMVMPFILLALWHIYPTLYRNRLISVKWMIRSDLLQKSARTLSTVSSHKSCG